MCMGSDRSAFYLYNQVIVFIGHTSFEVRRRQRGLNVPPHGEADAKAIDRQANL